MEAVQYYHREFSLDVPLWGEATPFPDEVFADDGMSIEVGIGRRPRVSVAARGTGARPFCGSGAIVEINSRQKEHRATHLIF